MTKISDDQFNVVCIKGKPLFGPAHVPFLLVKDQVYTVINTYRNRWGIWYELSFQPGAGYPVENFSRVSFNSSEVSQQLAEEACKDIVEVDVVRVKETETASN